MHGMILLAMALTSSLSDQEVRTQVLAYVSTIDVPIQPAAWTALGPRAGFVLRGLIENTSNLPTRRAKALDGLAVVAGQSGSDVFRSAANSGNETLVVRLAGLRALGHVFEGNALGSEVVPILQRANDPRIRASAAEQLTTHKVPNGCESVKAQYVREAPQAQLLYARALKACGSS